MIEIKHVHKKYGKKAVLDDMSFTAKRGEITCLIGVNGTGKTTLLKAIMGLTPIKKGEILIDGKKLTKETFKKIAFIPDTMTMPQNFTIEESMDFMADFYEEWNVERAEHLLDFFRLHKDEKIESLSKGNAAKVNLLLGLALDVEYLLMDEPFSGIDIFSREQIANVFSSHLIENRGVIITTHEINEIEHLIDQAVLLNEGNVLKTFNTEDMREDEGKSVEDIMREVYQV